MMKKRMTGAGLLLGLGIAGPPARAQSMDLILSNFTSSAISNNIVLSHANATGTTAALYGKRSSAAAKAGRTAYVTTVAARQQALRSQQAGQPAAQAQQFAAAFGPGGRFDYAALYRQATAGTSLRDNDLADVITAYVVASYQVAHGAAGALLPASLAQAARTQLAPAVARVAASKPAATLAALGEYYKLQTALLAVGAQRSTPAFRQNVAARLRQRFHLDVLALKLTDKGFAKK